MSLYLLEQTEVYFAQIARCLRLNAENCALVTHRIILRMSDALSTSDVSFASDDEATR